VTPQVDPADGKSETAKLSLDRRYGSHSIATKDEKHAAIRNTGLPVFEFLLGTGIRQFSTLYDECLGSRVSAG
jgi:hypothetical protein